MVQGRSVGIVWLRQDLRIHDNPALNEAVKQHDEVVLVFLWCPEDEGNAAPGGAAQIWLKESLRSLDLGVQRLGSKLVLRRVASYARSLLELAQETGAGCVYFCRRYEPWSERLDQFTLEHLDAHGVKVQTFSSYLLYEPKSINLGLGYTSGHWGTLMPFYKACSALGKPRRPLQPPSSLRLTSEIISTQLDDLGLETGISKNGENWGAPIREAWPGISECEALRRLEEFIKGSGGLCGYEKNRSRADLKTNPNSKLSAFLKWGQLSPHDIFWAVQDAGLSHEETKTFVRRLFWRDLAYFQLYHFPEMRKKSIRAHYDSAEWCEDRHLLHSWQRGCTGYPLVDASMRELRRTGWVQQNMRMVSASFLTEFLNISWVEGAKWFERQLVDADHAINSMMWQNAGRSGIDQWNFLMSPVTAKAQDPSGEYVRRWIPEIASLPVKHVHAPWDAPAHELARAGICLGKTYPHRCIEDLKAARDKAKQSTLRMRQSIADTWMNDQQGYDVITLLGGQTTKVFTKQEYRLPKDGAQSQPNANVSKPERVIRKGLKKRNLDKDPSPAPQAKSQRIASQLRIDDFIEVDQHKSHRWGKLAKCADHVDTIILDE